MRKSIIILAFLLTALSGVFNHLSAQQIFKVYKQDGSLEVFYYSTLDSITFKNHSGADDELIQLFHTQDSIYQIPVNEIDSVSFTTLPTIYKPEAIQLDGKIRDYILGSDSLTLYVKTSIPEKLLPKQGDNIATLKCDNILPDGFIGKVETISHDENAIRIECTQASMIDVFECVELSGTATTNDNPSSSNLPPGMSRAPGEDFITIPSIKGTVNVGHEIKAPANFTQTYSMTSSLELATQSCRVNWTYLHNCGLSLSPLPNVYCHLSYQAENTITLSGSFGSEIKWEKEIPVQLIRNIRVPGAVSLIEIFEEAGIFINISGAIALDGYITKPFTTILNLTYDQGRPTAIPPTFKMIGHEPITETTLEGEAAITLGVYGKLGIAPGVKEVADIEAGFKLGAKFSSSLSLTPAATPIEELNTEMYDEMDRDDFFRGDFTLTGEISANILNNKVLSAELEFGDIFKKNPFYKRGIVPHFEEVSLKNNDKSNKLTANAKMSRKLMFDAPVGFAIYDANKKLVDKWWSPNDYQSKEGEILTHDFAGLPGGVYTLHPITRAMKDNMVANPSSEGIIIPAVTTTEATNVAPNSSTLNGLLEGTKNASDFTCGFYYSTSPSVGSDNGTYCRAGTYNEGSFSSTIKNLDKNTEYFYRACLIVGDEVFLADEVKSFITSDEYDIDFDITYPSYYNYDRTWSKRPNDRIRFSVAVNPHIGVSDKGKVIAYGPVIYNDGAFVAGKMEDIDQQFLIDGWVAAYHWVYRQELEINNNAYRAVAPKTYKVGVQLTKVTESGDTITMFSKVKKDLNWVYDERPAMFIYHFHVNEAYDHARSEEEYSMPNRFSINPMAWFDTTGGFWIQGAYKEDPNLNYLCPLDNYSISISDVFKYSIYNIPKGVIGAWVDVNGNVTTTQVIPYQHDEHGNVLPIYFEDYNSPLHQNGYEFLWPTIYKNSSNKPTKHSVSESDFIVKETENGKMYIRKPSYEGDIQMMEK